MGASNWIPERDSESVKIEIAQLLFAVEPQNIAFQRGEKKITGIIIS